LEGNDPNQGITKNTPNPIQWNETFKSIGIQKAFVFFHAPLMPQPQLPLQPEKHYGKMRLGVFPLSFTHLGRRRPFFLTIQ
jgi:hypothetical protein